MKTAEVAIEYILTGLLALCAFVLPFWSGPLNFQDDWIKSGAIFGLLGLAYPLGIIFDKLADTVLTPIEQYLRLCQASEGFGDAKKKKKVLIIKELGISRLLSILIKQCLWKDEHKSDGDKSGLENNHKDNDLFPQDDLELFLRGEDGRREWMNSLRSRIRVTRNFAIFGPPSTAGILIYLISEKSGECYSFLHTIATLLFFIILFCLADTLPVIKTYELSEVECLRKKQLNNKKDKMYLFIDCYVLVSFLYITIFCFITSSTENEHYLFLCIAGILISRIALWAWYNITRTYMKFLYQHLPNLTKGAVHTEQETEMKF